MLVPVDWHWPRFKHKWHTMPKGYRRYGLKTPAKAMMRLSLVMFMVFTVFLVIFLDTTWLGDNVLVVFAPLFLLDAFIICSALATALSSFVMDTRSGFEGVLGALFVVLLVAPFQVMLYLNASGIAHIEYRIAFIPLYIFCAMLLFVFCAVD